MNCDITAEPMAIVSAEHLNSKFCATPDVFEGKFGSIGDYLKGLVSERVIRNLLYS